MNWTYFGIGAYPPEYLRKIHGPYDPSRYYGKPDIPLGQVKMSELPAWLGRRSFHPLSVARWMGRGDVSIELAFGREIRRLFVSTVLNKRQSEGWWRWHRKYIYVRYGTGAPLLQFAVSASIFFYIINYKTLKLHNRSKYH